MNALRSVVSVFVSLSLVYCIIYLSESAFTWLFHLPPDPNNVLPHPLYYVVLNTVVYAVATILAGWLCILWSPSHPRVHLFLLFVLGESVGIFFTIAMWKTHPHWISAVWLLVWPFCLWIGGIALIDHPSSTFKASH